MKTFARGWAMMALSVSVLTACGSQKTSSRAFNKATEECAAAVIAKRYVVRFADGHREVIKAESDQDFIDGYLTRNLDKIDYAEPDYYVSAQPLNSSVTPASGSQVDNWGVQRIEADALWAQGYKGQNVKVAVIDTGMDIQHVQLAKRLFTNPGEQGTDAAGADRSTNGKDDDGNGYADDAGGWDFIAHKPLAGDHKDHGTHVSGIIAAEHGDTAAGPKPYVQGVAPQAKLLPLAFLDEEGSGQMSDAVSAIYYAVSRGVNVINASWGGPKCSRSLRDAVTELEKKNVLFVSAAGNAGRNVDIQKEYPASLNLAAQITVGATGELDDTARYSNFGALSVHVFAPGTNIVSTLPGNYMGEMTGTSMATPFVTGAVALLLSAEPQATILQIRQALYASAIHRNDYQNASQGRMNLRAALSELRRAMGK